MHAVLRAFILAALILPASINAAPAKRRPAARSKTVQRAAPKPSPTQILVDALALNTLRDGDDLFAACRRSDFKLLALALAQMEDSLDIEKGEFETQAEYDARRTKIAEAVNGLGPMIVCQPLDDNEDAPFTYDADKEIFSGTFAAHQNVWRDVKRLGSYVSKTRMGISATVKASAELEYDVDMSISAANGEECAASSYGEWKYFVHVRRQEAPSLKASGYLAFVGRLVPPFVATSNSSGNPTLDDPTDVYNRTISVSFTPSRAAIVGPGGMRPWECSFDAKVTP